MPGRRLNDNERRLLNFWHNPPANFPHTMLRQLRVRSDAGLRGIQRLIVPFNFPLTAICGKNGVGKSTVLSLSAISANVPANWAVYWGNTRPRRMDGAGEGYKFSDFFHRLRGGPLPTGHTIEWVLTSGGNETEYAIRCNNGRWSRVAGVARHAERNRLPERAVDYVPISRVLPPIESSSVRAAFTGQGLGAVDPLTHDSLRLLSYILGKKYDAAETRVLRGLSLPHCQSGTPYSGFDMGAGECAVIVLLSRMQRIPVGGLLLIEELELGLHAEAQRRLVEILVEFCFERKVQIICTTHSEVILDALPRVARVLLRKNGLEHEAVSDVSTRFAVHEMTGQVQPELMIYTEDKFAATLIEEALETAIRQRVIIRDIGDSAALARQSVAHLRMENPRLALSLFDGDCTDQQIETWIANERSERDNINPQWLRLPGAGENPERWILSALMVEDYMREFAGVMRCTEAEAIGHIEAMRVGLDAHDTGYVLSQRTGFDQTECRRRILRSVVLRHPELDPVKERITALLGGDGRN